MSEAEKELPAAPPHLFEDTDYGNFLPTEAVMSLAKKIHGNDPGKNNLTSEIMSANRQDAGEIASYLKKLGFHRLHKDIKYGCNDLVFEGNDHQVIRLVHKNAEKQKRLDCPFILQPIASSEVGEYRVEILPKVHSLTELINVKNTELRKKYGLKDVNIETLEASLKTQLIHDSLQQNIMFFEPKSENIAVVKNKNGELVPLIVDADAACQIPNSSYVDNNYGHMGRLFKVFVKTLETISSEELNAKATQYLKELDQGDVAHKIPIFTNFITDYKKNHAVFTHPAKYYADAQADHLESLKLEKGAPNKVLTDEQLDRALREFVADHATKVEQTYDPTKMLGYAALKAGVSKSEFGAAAKAVGERHFRGVVEKGKKRLLLSEADAALGDKRPGFCHQMLAELEKNHGLDLSSGRGA